MDLDDTRVLCLVCDQSEETCKALLEHMKVRKLNLAKLDYFFQETHELDLLKLIKDNNLDLYKRLKFINYIRKQVKLQWKCENPQHTISCSLTTGNNVFNLCISIVEH